MDDVPFAHLYWDDVAGLVEQIWRDAAAEEHELANFLVEFLGPLGER